MLNVKAQTKKNDTEVKRPPREACTLKVYFMGTSCNNMQMKYVTKIYSTFYLIFQKNFRCKNEHCTITRLQNVSAKSLASPNTRKHLDISLSFERVQNKI